MTADRESVGATGCCQRTKDKGGNRNKLLHQRPKTQLFRQDLICFETKQLKVKLLVEGDVAAVVFRPNGHFSELAHSVKRLSLFLKINPCRPLN